MIAILAVPELPPPAETAPETAGEESRGEDSFSNVLAAIEHLEAEFAKESPETNNAAFPLTTPTAASAPRLFGLIEFAPVEFEEGTSALPLEGGGVLPVEPTAAAPSAPVADPELMTGSLAFELDVQPMSVPGIAPEAEPAADVPEAPTPSAAADPEEEAVAILSPREAKPDAPEAAVAAPDAAPEAPREPPSVLPVRDVSRSAAAPPAPPQRVSEPIAIPELPPVSEPPRPTEAPRVAVRLEAIEGKDPVDVVVAQRGPSLHFSVHSADGRLGAEMRASLGDLTERLEVLGYRAASPVETDRAQSVREPSASEKSWSDGGGSGGSAFAGEQKRQGRQDRDQWRLEMENQSHGERGTYDHSLN